MELNLKKPVVFLDLETTGINISTDRIVEISLLKVSPGGKEQLLTLRINPEMPIPPKVTAIHGITDEDVADKPVFREVAKQIANFMEGCDLAGYNSIKFDMPVLAEEFMRAEVDFNFRKRKYIDVQVIYHKKEPRTLSAAYNFYCGKELVNAHSAETDTKATYEVLCAQLDKYSDLENDMDKLALISTYGNIIDFAGRIAADENGVEIFNFGKHKGRKVEDVFNEEPSYYSWMMNGDFPLYTKKLLTEIKLRSFGNKGT